MNIENWFPVPIGVHFVNEEKRNSIEKIVTSYIESNQIEQDLKDTVKTTYNDNYDFLEKNQLTFLKEEIIIVSNSYVHEIGYNIERYNGFESWLNVFEKNSSEMLHNHYGSTVSGCYYVNDNEKFGTFEVPDPIDERSYWDKLHKQYKRRDFSLYSINSVSFGPRRGMILLFPSWLKHKVNRNDSVKERISIAFNLYV